MQSLRFPTAWRSLMAFISMAFSSSFCGRFERAADCKLEICAEKTNSKQWDQFRLIVLVVFLLLKGFVKLAALLLLQAAACFQVCKITYLK